MNTKVNGYKIAVRKNLHHDPTKTLPTFQQVKRKLVIIRLINLNFIASFLQYFCNFLLRGIPTCNAKTEGSTPTNNHIHT